MPWWAILMIVIGAIIAIGLVIWFLVGAWDPFGW